MATWLRGDKVEKVALLTVLGIWIDKTINRKKIQVKTNSQILAISNKIKQIIQSSALKQIYNDLIQPHLSYGLLAWYNNIHGNVTNNARLFNLQMKPIHMTHKSKFIAHTYPI